jgi:hypothetical protein
MPGRLAAVDAKSRRGRLLQQNDLLLYDVLAVLARALLRLLGSRSGPAIYARDFLEGCPLVLQGEKKKKSSIRPKGRLSLLLDDAPRVCPFPPRARPDARKPSLARPCTFPASRPPCPSLSLNLLPPFSVLPSTRSPSWLRRDRAPPRRKTRLPLLRDRLVSLSIQPQLSHTLTASPLRCVRPCPSVLLSPRSLRSAVLPSPPSDGSLQQPPRDSVCLAVGRRVARPAGSASAVDVLDRGSPVVNKEAGETSTAVGPPVQQQQDGLPDLVADDPGARPSPEQQPDEP